MVTMQRLLRRWGWLFYYAIGASFIILLFLAVSWEPMGHSSRSINPKGRAKLEFRYQGELSLIDQNSTARKRLSLLRNARYGTDDSRLEKAFNNKSGGVSGHIRSPLHPVRGGRRKGQLLKNVTPTQHKVVKDYLEAPGDLSWDKKSIPVVVVEEHHEVLQYWFAAAKAGRISSTGNTLLHIDGHSDMATPRLVDGFPIGHAPRSKTQLRLMMQQNDVFIQGAMMANFISRVVFIWPKWDATAGPEPYTKTSIEIGRAEPPRGSELALEAEEGGILCFCNVTKTTRQCYWRVEQNDDDNPNNTNNQGNDFPSEYCKIILRGLTFEEIREDKALEMLQAGTLVAKYENVVLDLDEDYFGCESAAAVLWDNGMGSKWLQKIDDSLLTMFCPRNSKEEIYSDRFINAILHYVTERCRTPKQCTRQVMQEIRKKVLKHWNSIPPYGKGPRCKHANSKLLFRLVKQFSQMDEEQRQILAEVGFCMTENRKSSTFPSRGAQLRVCQGWNTPDDHIKVVYFHTPNATEISQRGKLLKDLLSTKHAPVPKVVTVARSVRDGYTPKKYFHRIELLTLNAVVNSGKGSYDVYFDEDLLGGRNGWPGRHKNIEGGFP